MNAKILVSLICLCFYELPAQDSDIERLRTLRSYYSGLQKLYSDSLLSIESRIAKIESENQAKLISSDNLNFSTNSKTETYLKSNYPSGKEIILVPTNSSVIILSYHTGYWKVKYINYVGYIHNRWLVETEQMKSFREIANSQSRSTTDSKSKNTSVSQSDLQSFLKEYARREWPGDYRMQKYHIEKQTKSVSELNSLMRTNGGIPKSVFEQILGQALNSWKQEGFSYPKIAFDYSMVVYELKKQISAYKALN